MVLNTIFRAVDQTTGVLDKIIAKTQGLSNVVNRLNSRVTSGLLGGNDALERRLSFMVSMGQAMVVLGSAKFAFDSIVGYQKELSHLQALTGVTGKSFEEFEKIIKSVSKSAGVGMTDTAKGFNEIANLMPQYLSDSKALGDITYASMMLGKAAVMEYGESASNLAGIMNIYNVEAKNVLKVTEQLAAGAKYGSANINNLSESVKIMGGTAKNMNISLLETITLLEAISGKGLLGGEGGTQMRAILANIAELPLNNEKMQLLNMGNVDIKRLTNTTLPLIERLQTLKGLLTVNPNIREGIIAKVFGKESLPGINAIIDTLDKMQELQKNIGESSGALSEMAARSTNNLVGAFKNLQASFDRIVNSSSSMAIGLRTIQNLTNFLAKNLDTIVSLASPLLYTFVITKTIAAGIWAINKAMTAFSFATGVAVYWLNIQNYNFAQNTIAMAGYRAAMRLASLSAMELRVALAVTIPVLGLFAWAAFATVSPLNDVEVGLDKTEDGFVKLSAPITNATRALRDYNAEKAKHKRVEDKYGDYLYDLEKGYVMRGLVDRLMARWEYGNIFAPETIIEDYIQKPVSMEKYGTPEEMQRASIEYRNNQTTNNYNGSALQNNINMTINAPKGTTVDFGGSGLMPKVNPSY